MQALYYVLTGAVLYVVADWILRQLERRRGALFPNRTIVFFGILLTLALITFQAIRYVADAPV